MKSKQARFASIDEYVATFPKETQNIMQQLRAAIKAAAPEAEEEIAYQMPTFALNGNLVLFSAWKNHIGFYGTSDAIQETLKDELSMYANEKGSLKFPFNKPLPLELIKKIVKLRVDENLKNASIKAGK
jgi:uncharacterized protein YdhG (YjbR/CyaY superfamily)